MPTITCQGVLFLEHAAKLFSATIPILSRTSSMQNLVKSCGRLTQRLAREHQPLNASQLASFGPALRHYSAVPEPVEGKFTSFKST